VLKETLHIGSRSNFEPESLWRVSNSSRDEAIGTLIDLHQRLEVKKHIPRPLSVRRSGPQIPHPSDRLRVSHPPPPRPEPMPSQELAHHRPEDLALVPYGTTDTNPYRSSIDSRASSSLSFRSSYCGSDYQLDLSSTQPVSERFRESISSALADPSFGGASRKTVADLLHGWREDIDQNRLSTMSAMPSPTSPQSSQFLEPDQVPNRVRQSMMRHSSAPSTPVFSQRSYSPLYESQPVCAAPSTPTSPRPESQRPTTSFSVRSYNPIHESQPIRATPATPARSPTLSRPGLQYNSQGMIGGERHRSDSYVPSVMATPRTATVPPPTISVQSGFTHNRPNNSAKASADEIFSRVP
jgi:hypothetical protein